MFKACYFFANPNVFMSMSICMLRLILLSIASGIISACQNDIGIAKTKLTPVKLSPEWVALPGGCFNMGDERVYPEESPVTNICAEPFELSSHEVTNAEFAQFISATNYKTRAEKGWAASDARGPGVDMAPGSAVFIAPEKSRNTHWWQLVGGANWKNPLGPNQGAYDPMAPVVHITREDAIAYADWAGARLPSEAEWEYAARGGLDGELMSWAEAEDAALKDKANTWQGLFPVINSADDGHIGVAAVGSYPANGFGLYDMIGNVWEWTSSNYYPSHNAEQLSVSYPQGYDPAQGKDIPVGVIKGGSFLCAKSYCFRYRPAARQAQDLIFGTSHIGFRLARDVPNP